MSILKVIGYEKGEAKKILDELYDSIINVFDSMKKTMDADR